MDGVVGSWEPKKDPPEVPCPKCGLEARAWPDVGIVCPVCSNVIGYLDMLREAMERRQRGNISND